ncbi:MAG: hypothetical protein VYB45_06705 [Pseudomonadota bacterium]|nr:hypothetical protein [Pseudomonadota bacterium]
MNCSDVITEYLTAASIQQIFGYPGDPSVGPLKTMRCDGLTSHCCRRH